MSLRKKLNLVCVGLCVVLAIVLFLPVQQLGDYKLTYWGESDHLGGIFYLLEFVGALAFYLLYHFKMVDDNKYALFFLGDFLVNNLVILIRMMNGEVDYIAYGYWIGLFGILALTALNFICNVVSDEVKPKNNYPRGNGFNGGGYGGPMPPYNNMYNQQQPPYGQPMNNNQQGPMGYNNYR